MTAECVSLAAGEWLGSGGTVQESPAVCLIRSGTVPV